MFKTKLYLERAQCDLFDFAHARKINEHSALIIAQQLLEAVQHVHAKGFWHADLKMENVLVFQKDTHTNGAHTYKLADFELARKKNAFAIGTMAYLSPEIRVYCGSAIDDDCDMRPSDMWAMGVMLHVLLTRVFPNRTHSPLPLVKHFSWQRDLSQTANTLLSGLLCDQESRWTAADTLKYIRKVSIY